MSNDNKGFTLVEVIIAIFAFSIICGTVLQLFILSGNMEEKTYNLEMANIKAVNAIELCKLADSYDDIEAEQTMFFNKEWGQTEKDSESAAFILSLSIKQIEDGLYDIEAKVTSVKGNELISLRTSKYYLGGLS